MTENLQASKVEGKIHPKSHGKNIFPPWRRLPGTREPPNGSPAGKSMKNSSWVSERGRGYGTVFREVHIYQLVIISIFHSKTQHLSPSYPLCNLEKSEDTKPKRDDPNMKNMLLACWVFGATKRSTFFWGGGMCDVQYPPISSITKMDNKLFSPFTIATIISAIP